MINLEHNTTIKVKHVTESRSSIKVQYNKLLDYATLFALYLVKLWF